MKVREKATKHLKKVETSKKPKYPWADSSEKEKKEAKERKREQSKGDVVETSLDQLFIEERFLWIFPPFNSESTLWAFSPICVCLMSPGRSHIRRYPKRETGRHFTLPVFIWSHMLLDLPPTRVTLRVSPKSMQLHLSRSCLNKGLQQSTLNT